MLTPPWIGGYFPKMQIFISASILRAAAQDASTERPYRSGIVAIETTTHLCKFSVRPSQASLVRVRSRSVPRDPIRPLGQAAGALASTQVDHSSLVRSCDNRI